MSSDGSKEPGMRGQIIGAIKAQASGGGASTGSYVGSRRVSMGYSQDYGPLGYILYRGT